MIDAQTYNRLQNIIRREGRSLLQYADDSFPWANNSGGEAAVAEVKRLAASERDAYSFLGRLLVKHRLSPPWLGAFPVSFTSFNYLTIARLVSLLIEHQRRGIAELESDLQRIAHGECREALRQLLEVKKANLSKMESLAHPSKDGEPVPSAPAKEPVAH